MRHRLKFFLRSLSWVTVVFLMVGCGDSVYPDRTPGIIENIRVDSVKIVPIGSRFVLADSQSQVQFIHFYPGYACSEILEMGLVDSSLESPAAFKPKSRVRLPSTPDCALESKGRDTTFSYVFRASGQLIRLANSSGKVTDLKEVVRGTIMKDSLEGVLDSARTIQKGAWTFRDSTALTSHMLLGDSLAPCVFLNQADFTLKGDTVKVRLSYVTKDSSAIPNNCFETFHSESIAVRRRSL